MGGTQPKCLIPLDDREPLLHYLLAGLGRAGIDDLLVVTGFRPAEVESYVSEHYEGTASFVRNARYASWGNFHSVRMAIDQSPGMDLLVVNSDIVIHPDVFGRVVDELGDLVLAVERRDSLDAEEMRVTLAYERVTAIGKHLPMQESHGEFAGVSLLRPAAGSLYTRIASALEWRAETSLYYEDVYASMLGSLEARTAAVAPGEYAEVDTPEDVPGALAVLRAHGDAWERRPAVDQPA